VGPVGTAVPPKFEPRSATFISAHTGWVLGQAPCKTGTCDAVVRTRDGGRTWRAVPAPATTPDHLVGIRFADTRNGFVYGDRLWVTHDGGGTWKPVLGLTQVGPLEAAQGRVWFVTRSGLLSGPVTGDSFGRESVPTTRAGLVVHGRVAFTTADAGHGRTNLVVAMHGGVVRTRSTPCTNSSQPIVGVLTVDALMLVCAEGAGAGQEQKSAYTSADGGTHWTPITAPVPIPGTAIFLTPRAAFIIDSRSVEVTRDGGRSWAQSLSADGIGEGGFESSELGYAIGDFGSGTAMRLTRDTGRTWTSARF
jgi:photosystem II stability/assembly factor-like uncharacterized protein